MSLNIWGYSSYISPGVTSAGHKTHHYQCDLFRISWYYIWKHLNLPWHLRVTIVLNSVISVSTWKKKKGLSIVRRTKEFDAHVTKFIGLCFQSSLFRLYLYNTYPLNILKKVEHRTEFAWIIYTKTVISHKPGNFPLRVQPRLELGHLWWYCCTVHRDPDWRKRSKNLCVHGFIRVHVAWSFLFFLLSSSFRQPDFFYWRYLCVN